MSFHQRPELSVVIPVFNAESIIDVLVDRLVKAVSDVTAHYEILLIDDGSSDRSWEAVKSNCGWNTSIKGLRLSRNFGQHYAISAGLDRAAGEWIVVMDCDLQDRPEEIKSLYDKAQQGYDIVIARRKNRQDSFLKKLFSRFFYNVLSYLTGTRQDSDTANFGIYRRQTIQAVNKMRESIRYFPTMINWVGFRKAKIDVVHGRRESGKTTYNFKKLLDLSLDIILAYSDKPLRLTVKFGLVISLLSSLVALYYLYLSLTGQIAVLGFASIIISIWFLAGLTISILGVVGLYVGKIFEGVKNRPIYITAATVNFEPTDGQ